MRAASCERMKVVPSITSLREGMKRRRGCGVLQSVRGVHCSTIRAVKAAMCTVSAAHLGTFRMLAPAHSHVLMFAGSMRSFKRTRAPKSRQLASPREAGLLFHLLSVRENHPMRPLFIGIVVSGLGADATSAQTNVGSPPASPFSLTTLRLLPIAPTAGVSPRRQSQAPPLSPQKVHDRDVADCMRMWDSGTHMTKQEWAHTCKRVQTRLDNLKVDGLIPDRR